MNPQRGEAAIMIDGEMRKLCLTLGALAEIEAAHGCDTLKDLSLRLKSVSARDLMKLLKALLRGGGERNLAGEIETNCIHPKDAMAAILACFRGANLDET